MPGRIHKIGTFSDWEGLFKEWREEIGVNNDAIRGFKFDTLYGAIETEEISFGYYKGRRKWENVRQIPTQNMRDALMNLIVYQGDTEFASVEQQRYLFETAPSDYDRSALTRVMIEEMRHGWQMCALLIDHFGTTGKVEAQKMLERKAYENKRLLGSFNEECDNWLDFFAFTDFVDRDGKFQLQMLKYSAFAPLGRSMSYMLREEAFHMGTGNTGLARIAEARKTLGMTQVQLAELMGVAQQVIGSWEVGRSRVPVASLQGLARALAVTVADGARSPLTSPCGTSPIGPNGSRAHRHRAAVP